MHPDHFNVVGGDLTQNVKAFGWRHSTDGAHVVKAVFTDVVVEGKTCRMLNFEMTCGGSKVTSWSDLNPHQKKNVYGVSFR